MRKKDLLFKLKKAVKEAEKRQSHNAVKDSGHIKGLKEAISIVRNH
ncbi:hypothetical protein SFC57_02390 [Niallia circulans]